MKGNDQTEMPNICGKHLGSNCVKKQNDCKRTMSECGRNVGIFVKIKMDVFKSFIYNCRNCLGYLCKEARL